MTDGFAEHAAVSAVREELRLAERLIEEGRGVDGTARLEALVRAYPDYFAARASLARQRLLAGQFAESRTELEAALRLSPDNVKLLVRIAQIDKLLGDLAPARMRLRLAEQLDRSNTEVSWELAQIEVDEDLLDAAVTRLKAQPTGLPWHAALLTRLADAYERMGQTADAASIYERIFVDPQAPLASRSNAAFRLCSVPSAIPDRELLRYLDAVEGAELATHAAFARGELLMRRQEHAAAWGVISEANQQKWRVAEPGVRKQETAYARIHHYCANADVTPVFFEEPGGVTNPILIVGASRSGKSLVEQLLAGIGQVARGFEAGLLAAGVSRAARMLKYPPVSDPWYLDASDRRVLHRETSLLLRERAAGCNWLTLTSPSNVFHVGTVAQLFPNAPIVFVKRNIEDLFVRIFATNYASGHGYSYNIESLKRYIAWSDSMATAWIERLGDRCVTVRYEDLVVSPQLFVDSMANRLGSDKSKVTAKIHSDVGVGAPYASWTGNRSIS